ncbi:hypothetical protein [Arthrobacter sp. zg-Y1110]|uniref:hypothetical protein n=1 Tax=Arthrobacter sp. zg-Y1110 TaxID=2886932 RepID=UPI001D137CF2|nr:hypothetical protein [Arthrobacter sp. zg-Y1110]MCC3292625.1 hypothetical protein [Arthrobacter sp. zg-Y1110]UWX86944.1 hypothetical protein N2K99_16460 [Arthrobacter sp. zg-Y1110]
MSNFQMNRQPEGIPTGGQFAATAHSEPDVSIATPLPQPDERIYQAGRHILWENENGEEYAGVISGVDEAGGLTLTLQDQGTEITAGWDTVRVDPDREAEAVIKRVEDGARTFTLTHVAYDDRLMDDQVKKYLNGQHDDVVDEISETFGEYNFETASEEARDLLKEAGVDFDDVDTDKFDELVQAIREKDDSSPMDALVRNTPEKLMRLTLDKPAGDGLYDGNVDGVQEAREAKIAEMLTAKGLDVSSPEAKEAIGELVANGPQYWHESVDLDVIYFDDIRDSTIYNEETGAVASREIQFKDPNILLLDRANGSGHDVKIPGMIKATASEQSPVKLDADPDYGYGWDETAGVVHSAYRTDTANTWLDVEANEAAA